MKRAQIAIEFVTYFGLLMIILLITIVAMNVQFENAVTENVNEELYNIGKNIKLTLDMISLMGEGTNITLYIPDKALSEEYSIERIIGPPYGIRLITDDVTIEYETPAYNGEFHHGENHILQNTIPEVTND